LIQNGDIYTPVNWIGKQFYSFTSDNDNNETARIIMVPFSDASQTGAKSVVWIKRKNDMEFYKE